MITYPGRRIFRIAGERLAWRLEERLTSDVSVSTGSLPRSYRLGIHILSRYITMCESHIVKIKLKYHMKVPLASFPVLRLYSRTPPAGNSNSEGKQKTVRVSRVSSYRGRLKYSIFQVNN